MNALALTWVSAVDRLRWPLVALIGVLVVICAGLATRVGVDNAVDVWFVQGDPALTAYHEFQDRYGNDEVVALAVHSPDGVLGVDGWNRIHSLSAAAQSVDGIAEVVSVSHLSHVRTDDLWEPVAGEAPPFVIGPLMDALPTTAVQAERLAARVMEDPLVRGRLVSSDGKTALVVARMQATDDIDAVRDQVLDRLNSAVTSANGGRVPSAGVGVVFSALNVASTQDAGLIGGLSYVLIAVLLALMFRRAGPVLLTLAVVMCSVIITFGAYGAMGRDLNMVTMALPTLILIIGVADCVHMLHRVAESTETDGAEKVRAGVASVLWPCLFATLTTAAGFSALGTAKMQVVRDLGWFAALGVVCAFVITLVFVLAFGRLSFMQPRPRAGLGMSGVLNWVANLAITRAPQVLGVAALTVLIGAWGVSKLQVDTYSIDYFYASHPVRLDSASIEHNVGPYTPLEFTVRGEDLRTPQAMGAIADWQDAMAAQPDIGWTRSAADVIRRLNQVLTDGAPESFVVPDDAGRLEESLFLYESDPDGDLHDLVDDDWTEARVTVGIPMLSAQGFDEVIDRLVGLPEAPAGLEVTPAGYLPLYVTMMDYVVRSQVTSFVAAFVVIFALLALLFRSLRMALLALPANLLPLFMTLGLMGASGIRLDVATVTIAALVLGLVVDDTTHFLFRFRTRLREGVTHEQAVRDTLSSTGVAMTTTSLVLIVGFSVLGLATVKSVAYFGVLSAAAMCSALVADLVVMPALLVTLKPKL
jgi:predicted RND superfamily exporter protein